MSEWRECELGDVVADVGGSIKTGPFGTTLKAAEYSRHGMPVLSVGEIGHGRLDVSDSTPRVDAGVSERLSEYVLLPRDIVVARKGAVERSALIPESSSGYFLGSDGLRIRLDQGVLARFVAYQMQSRAAREWLLRHAAGSTLLSMNQTILGRLPIRIPPEGEQRTIADLLGALDDKIEANRKLAAAADELALLQYTASVSKLEQRRMSEVFEPRLGATPKRSNDDYWGGSRPWVSVKDVSMAVSGVILETDENISDLAIAETRARPLPAGSVVLTARGTVGKVARLAVAASFNQSCYAFVPEDVSPALVYFAVRDAANALMGHVHGSVFDTITTRTFDQVTVPELRAVPPPQIARISALLDVVENALRQAGQLATLRDTLLPKLMAGQLRVEEAAELVS